jgi:hypothetical protein
MTRTYIKIGDIFCVKVENNSKRYFQYIINDSTQLNSNVVRVFKKLYPLEYQQKFEEIIADEIEFYTHIIIKLGLKLELWEKAGHQSDIGNLDVMFKSSLDFGNPSIKISERWEVWEINQPPLFVGKLEEKYKELELGPVVSPMSFVDRLRTGKYNFFYPGY